MSAITELADSKRATVGIVAVALVMVEEFSALELSERAETGLFWIAIVVIVMYGLQDFARAWRAPHATKTPPPQPPAQA